MEGHQSHPVFFIQNFFSELPWVSHLELGMYHYVPQQNTDNERTILKVSPHRLIDVYQKIKVTLTENEDIAFQSKIHTTNGKYHMILVDFATNDSKKAYETASKIVHFSEAQKGILVYSGRSFHLYAFSLHNKKSWTAMMGQCLLCNAKDKERTIDDRWIGHRLVSGYGALRLTCNSKNYLTEPYVIKTF